MGNLITTTKLFIPMSTKHVPDEIAALNVDFVESYTDFKYPPREESENTFVPEHKISSGDFFGVVRHDGLDDMLAWGMGSTTGHTTTPIWFEDGLYVTESTVDDSYWPTDGIQRTPYKQWLKQAREASFNVVHVPLNDEAKAKFNETAAREHFFDHEGLEYGYQVMFWGWIDTLKDNYPCLPPTYSNNCLQWELLESVFAIIDRSDSDLSNLFWNQAMNHRLNTQDLNTADLWYESFKQGIDTNILPTLVEQDDWDYKTTKFGEEAEGRAMVCCVWVSSVWKAAGMFDEFNAEMNAGEQTNYDDYVLTIFEDSYTQILGKWTLDLNDFFTKDPYAHMAEQCGGLPPSYEKPDDC